MILTSLNICHGYSLELPHRGNDNKSTNYAFSADLKLNNHISIAPDKVLFDQ